MLWWRTCAQRDGSSGDSAGVDLGDIDHTITTVHPHAEVAKGHDGKGVSVVSLREQHVANTQLSPSKTLHQRVDVVGFELRKGARASHGLASFYRGLHDQGHRIPPGAESGAPVTLGSNPFGGVLATAILNPSRLNAPA